MKIFLTIVMLFSLCTLPFADEVAKTGAEVGKWTMDVDAAYKLAEQKKLPIIMNFTGSDWCYWCKIMDQNVFSKKEWKDYAKDKWILITIDFPSDQSIVPENFKERNDRLARELDIKGYPTYIVMNHKQDVIGELRSGQEKTPESFKGELETVVNLSEDGIQATLDKLSTEKQAEYKSILAEYENEVNGLNAWLATGPKRTDENITKYQEYIKKLEKIEEKLRKYW